MVRIGLTLKILVFMAWRDWTHGRKSSGEAVGMICVSLVCANVR